MWGFFVGVAIEGDTDKGKRVEKGSVRLRVAYQVDKIGEVIPSKRN